MPADSNMPVFWYSAVMLVAMCVLPFWLQKRYGTRRSQFPDLLIAIVVIGAIGMAGWYFDSTDRVQFTVANVFKAPAQELFAASVIALVSQRIRNQAAEAKQPSLHR